MNRITARFAALREKDETAFIPFVTAGDPTLDATAGIILALENAGCDIIECGVPYSDPVADGVVIQAASQRALKHGVSLRSILGFVSKLRDSTEIPIVIFTYHNPVLAYGFEAFANDAAAAGVDGVLCVDLPPEEAAEYQRLLGEKEIATVFLVAPTSTPERIALIARASTGFVYYVSRTGVTGERDTVEETVGGMVAQIRQHTDKPVAVGFGISKPEHAEEVASYADGVVVGSAIVRLIGDLGAKPGMADEVGRYVKTLVQAAKGLPGVAGPGPVR